jgi:hypothetical protein
MFGNMRKYNGDGSNGMRSGHENPRRQSSNHALPWSGVAQQAQYAKQVIIGHLFILISPSIFHVRALRSPAQATGQGVNLQLFRRELRLHHRWAFTGSETLGEIYR